MHVCFVYHHFYPADFSTALNEYTTKLVDNGIEVTVIAGRESDSIPYHEVHKGVEVYRILTDLSTSVSIEPTWFGYRAVRLLDKLSGQTDFDILHLRSFPNTGLILRPLPWLEAPDNVISDVRGTAVSNAVFEAVSRIGIRLQDKLVNKTVVIDKLVGERIFSSTDDVAVLPLGVDFETFRPDGPSTVREEYDLGGKFVIGYTGNLHPSREINRLVDTFSRVVEQYPNAHLLVVGGGSGLPDLKKKVRSKKLTSDVTLTGRVSFELMPEYVRAFDLGAAYVPDKPQYRNQPPLKTVEYLASGLPVVATDTPGNRRFVNPSQNAVVVEDDIRAYSNAMIDMIERPEVRRALADSARESVKEFDYDRIVQDKLIPLYRQVAGEVRDENA